MSEIQYENNDKKYLLKDKSNNKKTKNFIILVLIVMFSLGIILVISSISKISTIGNRETGTVDYKVYLKDNDFYQDKYLVKGRAMVTGSDLIARVKNDELITGSLYLINKYGDSVEPRQETFNTDFYLAWVE